MWTLTSFVNNLFRQVERDPITSCGKRLQTKYDTTDCTEILVPLLILCQARLSVQPVWKPRSHKTICIRMFHRSCWGINASSRWHVLARMPQPMYKDFNVRRLYQRHLNLMKLLLPHPEHLICLHGEAPSGVQISHHHLTISISW